MEPSSEINGELNSETLSGWFNTDLGRYLLAREQQYYDSTVADIFGFHALQVGLPQYPFLQACRIPTCITVDPEEPSAQLCADPHYLPFPENSLDLIVLPHALEFSGEPHQLLRETYRTIRPEGQLVLSCFNPYSMWGAKRYFGRQQTPPWNGEYIGLYRMKDWLSLLGFEVIGGRLDCYVPPLAQSRWLQRFAFCESAGDRWWPIAGGVYFLRAIKRVVGMRVITPTWRQRARRKKALATASSRVRVLETRE
jgi:SAM-dependent methyltransferase